MNRLVSRNFNPSNIIVTGLLPSASAFEDSIKPKPKHYFTPSRARDLSHAQRAYIRKPQSTESIGASHFAALSASPTLGSLLDLF